MRRFSATGRRFTEGWEDCVLYVYDDKVPKCRIDGVLRYPEWDGGAVKGTLTIGIGHTDAAGAPKIHQGMRLTHAEADQIFANDIAPCERAVNRALRVPVTQHQFDALVDTTFNCPSALPKLAALVNAGKLDAVPAKLMQYTFSKGERMRGLVRRRAGAVQLWNTQDDPDTAEAESDFAPKGDRDPPPKPMSKSKTGVASATIGVAGVVETVQAVNDAVAPVKEAKDTIVQAKDGLKQLGIFDQLAAAIHSPTFWLGVVIVGFAIFIWWDRRNKLVNDHV